MRRAILLALLLAPALLFDPSPARAQDWSPPARQMPLMPRSAEIEGNWLTGRTQWFDGVERLSGIPTGDLDALGEPRPRSDYLQVVRFSRGPVPVVVWVDRNSDDRADMVEIYRSGGVIIQLVDADYDGNANVLRVYDSSGALTREQAL